MTSKIPMNDEEQAAYDLFSLGLSIPKIANIRKKEVEVIKGLLLSTLEKNHPFNASELRAHFGISQSTWDQIKEICNNLQASNTNLDVDVISRNLQSDVSTDHIRLYLGITSKRSPIKSPQSPTSSWISRPKASQASQSLHRSASRKRKNSIIPSQQYPSSDMVLPNPAKKRRIMFPRQDRTTNSADLEEPKLKPKVRTVDRPQKDNNEGFLFGSDFASKQKNQKNSDTIVTQPPKVSAMRKGKEWLEHFNRIRSNARCFGL
mmetsp:Transcript_1528/g.1722  ORF Transcript_1528/g.1722 Transcript_1528/m.1722 type:complete len:262 (+) Transcript_1528:2-787(+)